MGSMRAETGSSHGCDRVKGSGFRVCKGLFRAV